MRTLLNVAVSLTSDCASRRTGRRRPVRTQIGTVELGVHHRLAELRHAHDEAPPFTLQLDDVGVIDGRLDRRRHAAGHIAVLQRGEALAVQHGVDVGRIGFEALADDHADLAVRIGAGADELHVRPDEEVAAHLAPRELELVARGPHVGAAGRQRVGLAARVVGGGALDGGRPEVRRRFEVADRRAEGRWRRVAGRRCRRCGGGRCALGVRAQRRERTHAERGGERRAGARQRHTIARAHLASALGLVPRAAQLTTW